MDKLLIGIAEALNKFGPTTILLAYMIYDKLYSDRENTDQLNDISNMLITLSSQISMLLSANISYRNGNGNSGDAYSEEAVRTGERLVQKYGGDNND